MKIAIVKLSSLGDIVLSMVALQFIKKTYPNSRIDWIVEEQFRSVLEKNPQIDNIFTVSLRKVKKEKSVFLLLRELRKLRRLKSYDIAIDAQGLLKSAIVAKIISKNKVIGFDKKSARESIASIFYNHKVSIGYDENTIDRNISVICKSIDIEVQSNEILNKKPFVFPSNDKKSNNNQYIVFVVGSTWESRNYPENKFLDIANKLKKKCIVIWGNESEMNKAKWMERQSDFVEAAPKLELDDLKQVINSSVLVIGNDSGPSHFAWAMNIPSIILFGPTPVNRVYQTKINRVLKSSSKVDHYNLDKDDFSIKEIQVNDIVEIAKELI